MIMLRQMVILTLILRLISVLTQMAGTLLSQVLAPTSSDGPAPGFDLTGFENSSRWGRL